MPPRTVPRRRRCVSAWQIPIDLLDSDTVRTRFGIHTPPGTQGVWQADTGVLRATSATAMFHVLAAKRGAELHDRSRVNRLHRVDGSGTWVVGTEDGEWCA